jgi:hypothetical protein
MVRDSMPWYAAIIAKLDPVPPAPTIASFVLAIFFCPDSLKMGIWRLTEIWIIAQN